MKKTWITIPLILSSLTTLQATGVQFGVVEKDGKTRSLVTDMSQFVSSNISRKSAKQEVHSCKETCKIFKFDKDLFLQSDSFGPLPVTFKVIDKNNTELTSITNEDNVTSKFIIPVNKIKSGAKIEVINAFDEKIFCKNVEKVEKK